MAFALLLASAACTPPMAHVPTSPSDDAFFVRERVPSAAGLSDVDDAPNTDGLTPGDVVLVTFVGDRDAPPTTTSVDREGRLHLPLLGDVRVAGLPLVDAEMAVQNALERYDRFTRVALTLGETKGRLVTVTGAVERPGNVPLVGDARLADVLATVGGPRQSVSNDRVLELGDIDDARVVRKGNVLPVDARKALQGVPGHNIRMRPGDVVSIPPALDGRIVVLGDVLKPTTFPFRKGMRLTEVLADAGGLAKSADNEDVRVLRGGYRAPKLYVANLKDVLAGVRPDVVLAPGDVVYVTEHWFASVGDVLGRIVPLAATAFVAGAVIK